MGVRITAFAGLIALVFAAAAWAGSQLDPKVEDNPHEETSAMDGHDQDAGGHETDVPAETPGLAVADQSLQLVLDQTRVEPAARAEVSLRIVDFDGETVRDFDVEHERRLHLIVIRRDMANFQHLHPEQQSDGSWRVEADLEPAGVYRVFADFARGGTSLTLAADLFVAGSFEPKPLPAPQLQAGAGDGYEVEFAAQPAVPGESSQVAFSVTRNGREVEGVEPYLGADGHLVALREHDLAFLHAHPEGEPGGPGPISFEVHYPSPGSYRLFLQFKHRGEVRTAAFTQVVEVADVH